MTLVSAISTNPSFAQSPLARENDILLGLFVLHIEQQAEEVAKSDNLSLFFTKNYCWIKKEVKQKGVDKVSKALFDALYKIAKKEVTAQLPLETRIAVALEKASLFRSFKIENKDLILISKPEVIIDPSSLLNALLHSTISKVIYGWSTGYFRNSDSKSFFIHGLSIWYVDSTIATTEYSVVCKVVNLALACFQVLKVSLITNKFSHACVEQEAKMLTYLQEHLKEGSFQSPVQLICFKNPIRAHLGKWYEGQSLSDWVKLNKPDLKTRIAIIYRIFRTIALPLYQSNKVRHLDIKPPNLLVGDSLDQIVLADWGGGYIHQENEDFSNGPFTPIYQTYFDLRALEKARLKKNKEEYREVTRNWDLYSFAVSFYWILTEKRPFPISVDFQGKKFSSARAPLDVKSLQEQNCPQDVINVLSAMLHKIRHKRLSIDKAFNAWQNIYWKFHHLEKREVEQKERSEEENRQPISLTDYFEKTKPLIRLENEESEFILEDLACPSGYNQVIHELTLLLNPKKIPNEPSLSIQDIPMISDSETSEGSYESPQCSN